MAMKIIQTILTPWAPYSVMFSRDGSRLAIGGGTWYGAGGVLLVELATGTSELSTCAELLSLQDEPSMCVPTVSGVCFSNDDRHLAASMWTSRHHAAPSVLFDVDRLRLHGTTPIEGSERSLFRLDPCPTGVLMYGRTIITRNHGGEPEDVVVIDALPVGRNVAADTPVQRYTNAGVIVVRETVITGGPRGMSMSQPDESCRESVIPEGLVLRPLDGTSADVFLPVPDCARVTAIASLDAENTFLSGGKDGQIDRWSWDARWRPRRLRAPQPAKTVNWPEIGSLTWATYTPNSIVGLVEVSVSDTWASITAGGELTILRAGAPEPAWQVPVPGTPRSIAAHPQEPWVAIGIKQGSFDPPQAAVAIIEVS
jgi:hypothetical protein